MPTGDPFGCDTCLYDFPAIMMTVSFGMGWRLVIKNGMLVMQLLQMGMNILVFLGGRYFPIDKLGRVMNAIANISPVKWVNQAIFRLFTVVISVRPKSQSCYAWFWRCFDHPLINLYSQGGAKMKLLLWLAKKHIKK